MTITRIALQSPDGFSLCDYAFSQLSALLDGVSRDDFKKLLAGQKIALPDGRTAKKVGVENFTCLHFD